MYELQVRIWVITEQLIEIWHDRSMLNPLQHGFHAIQLLSHKVLRYIAPLFLIASYLAATVLASSSVLYASVLAVGMCLLVSAAGAWSLERAGRRSAWFA